MTVTIPDDGIRGLLDFSEQARLELAVALFAGKSTTTSRGARIAGLTFLDFQRELGRREIPMHYGIREWKTDLGTIRRMDSR